MQASSANTRCCFQRRAPPTLALLEAHGRGVKTFSPQSSASNFKNSPRHDQRTDTIGLRPFNLSPLCDSSLSSADSKYKHKLCACSEFSICHLLQAIQSRLMMLLTAGISLLTSNNLNDHEHKAESNSIYQLPPGPLPLCHVRRTFLS
jgi:hypothetical protein